MTSIRDRLKESIIILGGTTTNGSSNDVEVYRGVLDDKRVITSLRKCEDVNLPSLKVHREALCAGLLDNFLMVAGGHSEGQSLDSTEYLELSDDENMCWKSGPKMKFPRHASASVVVKGKFYVFGGAIIHDKMERPKASCECFDPITKTWKRLQDMTTRRMGAVAVHIDNWIYVIGGRCTPTKILKTAERYHLIDQKWEKISSEMSKAREKLAATIWLKRYIMVSGGRKDNSTTSGTHEIFDTINMKWNKGCHQLQAKRSDHAMVFHQDNLIIFGGIMIESSDIKKPTRSVEVFTKQPFCSKIRCGISKTLGIKECWCGDIAKWMQCGMLGRTIFQFATVSVDAELEEENQHHLSGAQQLLQEKNEIGTRHIEDASPVQPAVENNVALVNTRTHVTNQFRVSNSKPRWHHITTYRWSLFGCLLLLIVLIPILLVYPKSQCFTKDTALSIDALKMRYIRAFTAFKPLSFLELTFEVEQIWISIELESTSMNLKTNPHADLKEMLHMTFEKNSVTVCKGEPGAGKTMLTNYLAYQWAKGIWTEFDIVLVAKLREVAYAHTILDAAISWSLENGFIFEDERHTLMNATKVCRTLIIIDGYDEATDAVPELRTLFSKSDYSLPFSLLVTTRPWATAGIKYPVQTLRILPLSLSQKLEYIKKHYEIIPSNNLNLSFSVLKRKLSVNCPLQKISETPLMLCYLCFYFQNKGYPEANTIFGILKLLVAYLIERYHDKIGSEPFKDDWRMSKIVNNLGKLALFGISQPNPKLIFSRADLRKYNVDEKHNSRSGLLVKDIKKRPGQGNITSFTFPHKVWQEFSASLYILKVYLRSDPGKLNEGSLGQFKIARSSASLRDLTNFLVVDNSMKSFQYSNNSIPSCGQMCPALSSITAPLLDVAEDDGTPEAMNGALLAILDTWPDVMLGILCPNLHKLARFLTHAELRVTKLTVHYVHCRITSYMASKRYKVGQLEHSFFCMLQMAFLTNFPVSRIEKTYCFYFPTLSLVILNYCDSRNLTNVAYILEKLPQTSHTVLIEINRFIILTGALPNWYQRSENCLHIFSALMIERLVTREHVVNRNIPLHFSPEGKSTVENHSNVIKVREMWVSGFNISDLFDYLTLRRIPIQLFTLDDKFDPKHLDKIPQLTKLFISSEFFKHKLFFRGNLLKHIRRVEFSHNIRAQPEQNYEPILNELTNMPALHTVEWFGNTYETDELEMLISDWEQFAHDIVKTGSTRDQQKIHMSSSTWRNHKSLLPQLMFLLHNVTSVSLQQLH